MNTDPIVKEELASSRKKPNVKRNAGKIGKAYKQIREFFSLTEFPLMKKLLHQWLLAGIEDQHQWKHEDTVDLIYKTEFLTELIGALWVLHKTGMNYTEEDSYIRDSDALPGPRFSSQVEDDLRYKPYFETDFYTSELSKKEWENPFSVVHALFKEYRPNELYRKLHHWRDTALTNPWEYNAMDKVEMTRLYKDIDRVVEAAFVINEIELLREELKDE